MKKAFPFLFRRPINPNFLTLLGTALSVGAGVAFALGEFGWGAFGLALGGFFDLIDGVVARHQGQTSTFGAFLDSTMDRLADMAVLLGLVVHFSSVSDSANVLLAGYTLIATVLVSYSKARAERYVEHFEGGFLERAERIVILILGGMTGLVVPALWIVAIGSTVTFLQRFVQAHREMERLDTAEEEVGDHL